MKKPAMGVRLNTGGINKMKKTKIICTMGPNTNDRELMKQLALNGMDVARFNFSHGDYEEHMGRFKILESVREELGLPLRSRES